MISVYFQRAATHYLAQLFWRGPDFHCFVLSCAQRPSNGHIHKLCTFHAQASFLLYDRAKRDCHVN